MGSRSRAEPLNARRLLASTGRRLADGLNKHSKTVCHQKSRLFFQHIKRNRVDRPRSRFARVERQQFAAAVAAKAEKVRQPLLNPESFVEFQNFLSWLQRKPTGTDAQFAFTTIAEEELDVTFR